MGEDYLTARDQVSPEVYHGSGLTSTRPDTWPVCWLWG